MVLLSGKPALMRHSTFTVPGSDKLVELVYELLDAHDDTTRLATELEQDAGWAAHLDYLRTLQRVGRELLAASASDSASPAANTTPAASGADG
jgi:hypothetical protein